MLDYRGYALNGYNSDFYHHGEFHDSLMTWISSIPLSRPVWDLGEDFADGILTGDIVSHFCPELINLKSMHVARNMSQRTANWHYLNLNVFPKFDLHVPHTIMVDLTNGVHCAAELFLLQLRKSIQEYLIRLKQEAQLELESARLKNAGSQNSLKNSSTAKQNGNLAAASGTMPPGSTMSKHSNTKTGAKLGGTSGNGASGAAGMAQINPNGDAYAPCREALKLKDKELGELQAKVKNHERVLREKVKMYENELRIKDSRIRELERRLELARTKHP